MSETAFSQGGWYSRPSTLRPQDTVIACLAGRIAEVSEGEVDPEQIANARLIAAAPDLYECARILAGLLDAKNGGRSTPTEEQCNFARAALSKLSQQQGSDATGTPQADGVKD